jgi:hypothetical protein
LTKKYTAAQSVWHAQSDVEVNKVDSQTAAFVFFWQKILSNINGL